MGFARTGSRIVLPEAPDALGPSMLPICRHGEINSKLKLALIGQ